MKFQRQAKILQLIEQHNIETQEDLSRRLRESEFDTTQATVSRDIKELRLIKVLSVNGKYKYATSARDLEGSFSTRLRNIFRECVTGIDSAQNIVVIKTLPGLGPAAGSAIDSMRVASVVGTLAGDDTVFVVMRDNTCAVEFCQNAGDILS